jgi:uncharacterized protein
MSFTSRVLGALVRAPRPLTRDVDAEYDVRLAAPDGVELLTDLYWPRGSGPLPAVLIRTPYGRRGGGGAAVLGGFGRLFAERGYRAVVQSTRGTFGSGGRIDFGCEAGDSRALADWVVSQPWSNGDVATFGPSYLSFVQWALASTRPPQLRAMAIQIMAADRRRSYYPGGAFALDTALTWTYGMSTQDLSGAARLRANLAARRALEPAFRHLPLLEADVVATGREVSFYRDWLRHEQPDDPFWERLAFSRILPELGVPVCMVGGWYDYYLPYQLDDHARLVASGADVQLTVGAWPHGSLGGLAMGFREALAWFDVHLRGRERRGRAPVRVEVMGGGGWRDLDAWPPPAGVQRWHLREDGRLATAPPPVSPPDRYRYDPADPTPAVGGTTLGSNSGPRDNRPLEARPDVLTYTSEPLAEDVEIMGPVGAELFVASSLEHTDLFARLCDVDERGRSVNVCDGLRRLRPGAPARAADGTLRVDIELWPTAHRFRRGHRVRLQVSSGAHPRFSRNLGTDEPLATGTAMRPADQVVHHDPEHPSAVLLPVRPAAGVPKR